MDELISSLFLFLLVVLPFVAAVGSRAVPRVLHNLRLSNTDAAHAADEFLSFAQGTYENEFGYPSGFFAYDDEATSYPEKVLLREAQPAGTITDGCAWGIVDALDDGGCGSVLAGLLLATPLFAVSLMDRWWRFLLRSKVVAEVKQEGPDSLLTIKFHGVNAWLVSRRYEQALRPPMLPEAYQ